MLATPTTSLGALQLPVPPLDPRPALSHAAAVAHEACRLTGDDSNGVRGRRIHCQLRAVLNVPCSLRGMHAARPSPRYTLLRSYTSSRRRAPHTRSSRRCSTHLPLSRALWTASATSLTTLRVAGVGLFAARGCSNPHGPISQCRSCLLFYTYTRVCAKDAGNLDALQGGGTGVATTTAIIHDAM